LAERWAVEEASATPLIERPADKTNGFIDKRTTA
jgi:hypothetical protein